jgi:Spy/CpxP family protein refolding chaperone
MKAETRNFVLTWSVVALIVLNVSTLGTIYYNRIKEGKEADSGNNIQIINQPGEDKFSGRYFRDKLNLSPEQMNMFQKFNPEFRFNAREINNRLSELRNEMLDELSSENPDRQKLTDLSDSIGYQHGKLKRLTFVYYLNIRELCSPEQRQDLRELFYNAFGSDTSGMQQNMMRRRNQFRGGRN